MQKNTVLVTLDTRKTNALCDTGAGVSCINKGFLRKGQETEIVIGPCHIKSVQQENAMLNCWAQ